MFALPAILNQNNFDPNALYYCPQVVDNTLTYNVVLTTEQVNYCPQDIDPSITINTIAGDNQIGLTELTSPVTISGTATNVTGLTVTVTLNGVDYTDTVSGEMWSVVVPVVDLDDLTIDTNYTVTATVIKSGTPFSSSVSVFVGDPPPDPYFNNVVLFVKGDGANNSTTIVDSSLTPKTITRFGDTKISTYQSKYGGSSIYFDGNNDYLEVIEPLIFSFPEDFTIECWFYTSLATTDQCLLTINTYTNGVLFRASSPDGLIYAQNQMIYPAPPNPSLNTWHHLAISRQGSSVYSFLDGIATSTKTINGTVNTGTSSISIGKPYSGNFSIDFTGYIDSLRVTKGFARYTANFDPETDTFLNT